MRPAPSAVLAFLALALPAVAQERLAILDAPLVVVRADQRLDHLLDWNGDGLMDFVALDQSTTSLGFTIYLNDGQGGLRGVLGFGRGGPSGDTRSHFETCDLDGDPRQDLLWVEPSAGGSTFFPGFMNVFARSTGPLGVQRFPHLDHEGPIDLGTVLDADLDGDADRVRVYDRTLTLDLFERDATGAWSLASTSALALPLRPRALVRMDYDGDAYLDLFLDLGDRGAFVALDGGELHPPVMLLHYIDSPMPMAIPGDVDGDGDQDLVIFDMSGYALYRRAGPASWTLEPRRGGGPAAKLADVDGDGDLDGVCCGGGGSYPKFFERPATFRIALNDGTGGFAPAFTIPGLGSREIAGAADLDGDGDVDLAAGQCIYYARGPLAQPPQRALARPQSTRSLSDFDRDGDADFTPGIGTFPRHLGNGRSRPFTLLCPPPPAGQSEQGPGLTGDWDGDGDLDLVVRRVSGTTFVDMHLLVNEGGGSYADGGVASTQDFLPGIAEVAPESSFVLDLDLDGDLDLATFRRAPVNTDDWTRTWLNDGQGRFTFAWQRTAAWPVGFGALHGSPAPDALLVRYAGGVYDDDAVAYLHAGLGDGSFASASSLSFYVGGDLGPASLALADLDHDGDLDLAGAFQFGGTGWFMGKGWFVPNLGGSLWPDGKVLLDDLDDQIVSSASHPTPRIAVAGDVDGDGLEDLILSSPLHRRAAISIVLRSPDDQGWLAPVRQVVYPVDPTDELNVAAVPGAIVDLDGDGDGEYVTDVIWNNVLHSANDHGSRRQDTSGVPDAGGRVPTLGARGPFRPGNPAALYLTGVPAGAAGVLALQGVVPGSKAVTLPGRFRPMLAFLTSGPAGPGAGSWSVAFDVAPSVAGLHHVLRAEVIDPLDGRLLRSNELELVFGR